MKIKMKQQLNEIKRMQHLAGLINESQLNAPENQDDNIEETRFPETDNEEEADFSIPANDAYDLDEEAEYMQSILTKARINAKCEAGFGEVEVYLEDKSQRSAAIKAIERAGYEVSEDGVW